MKQILLAASLVLAAATAGNAEDAIHQGVPAYAWSGLFVGAQVGFVSGRSSYVEPEYPGYGIDFDPDGFVGGVYAGYSRQLENNLVLGGEVDIYVGRVKGDDMFHQPDGTQYSDAIGSARLTAAGSVRARLGYGAGRFMPYVTGGLAVGHFKYRVDVPSIGDGFAVSKTFTSWTVGAGLEYALTENLVGRAEYRYTDFGSNTLVDPPAWATTTVKFKTSDIRLGIAYKF